MGKWWMAAPVATLALLMNGCGSHRDAASEATYQQRKAEAERSPPSQPDSGGPSTEATAARSSSVAGVAAPSRRSTSRRLRALGLGVGAAPGRCRACPPGSPSP